MMDVDEWMKNFQDSDRLSRYFGLRLVEIDGSIDDLWLIVCIEAAWYCTSRGVESIRFSDLRERCDEALTLLTHGKRTNFGGTYQRILDNPRYGKFFDVRKHKGKRWTSIYPKIEAIQNEVRSKRLDNFGERVIFGRVPGRDKMLNEREVLEPPVSISDSVNAVVTRCPKSLWLLMIQSSPCALSASW